MDRSHETIQPQIQNEPPLQGSDEPRQQPRRVHKLRTLVEPFDGLVMGSNGVKRCLLTPLAHYSEWLISKDYSLYIISKWNAGGTKHR